MKTNQMRTAKAIYSELATGKKPQPPLLPFGRQSKAGKGVEKLYSGIEGWYRCFLNRGLLAWRCYRQLNRRRTSYVIDQRYLIKGTLYLVCPKLEVGTKVRKAQLLIKSWPFGVECYCSAFWIVISEGNLASCKSYAQQAGFLGYLFIRGLCLLSMKCLHSPYLPLPLLAVRSATFCGFHGGVSRSL